MFSCALLASAFAVATAYQTVFDPTIPAAWSLNNYRIPALVRTDLGTLIAVAEARTTDADCTYKWLAFSRSTDNGTTWSEPAEVWGRSLPAPQGAGNPVLVYDAVSRTILLHGSVNSPGHCNPTLWTFQLTDGGSDGLHWTQPVNISGFLGKYGGVTPGPGAGAQLGPSSPHAGRLLVPGHFGAYQADIVWYSDDHGASWTLSPSVLPGLDEVAVAALPSGRVLLNARTDHANASCDCRAVSHSDDGGATWTPVAYDPTLIEPVCQGSLAYLRPLASAPAGALFFSNPASRTQRSDLTVRRSDDSGASWAHSWVVAPGPLGGGYSSLYSGAPVVSPNGSEWGGVLYEVAGVIAFSLFPAAPPPSPPPPPPPALIPASHPLIQWQGRHWAHGASSALQGAVSFDFPGVTATLAAANATFFTAVFVGACPTARLESGVDGRALDARSPGAFWVLPASPAAPYRITLAQGLAPGSTHVLQLRNAVEARWAGCSPEGNDTVTLAGVETDGTPVAVPEAQAAAPPRTLEWIGDSITAGFGTSPPCGAAQSRTEDSSRGSALGLVCSALGAACSLVAVSGDTVLTPPPPAPAAKPPLPLIYSRCLTYLPASPGTCTAAYSPPAPAPSALLLNLGTNDLGCANFNASYQQALTDFVLALASPGGIYGSAPALPTALLYCGPMASGYCSAMQAATAAAVAQGARAVFLGHLNATLDGCDGHPGQVGQRELGEALLPLIKAHMGW